MLCTQIKQLGLYWYIKQYCELITIPVGSGYTASCVSFTRDMIVGCTATHADTARKPIEIATN